ncbi:hypothetical protein FRB98_009207 [Tulasnella sp. 332]|nr:hypothetical protein FRB98_009207 [Tulasnella sp. 332]
MSSSTTISPSGSSSSSFHRHHHHDSIASSVFPPSGVGAASSSASSCNLNNNSIASDANRSIFATRLLGTPPPNSSASTSTSILAAAHNCPYPSPLSPNGGMVTLPPLSPMPAPQQSSSSPVLKLKPISELGLHPPLPIKNKHHAVGPLPYAPGRRRSLSMTHLPIYQHHYQYQQHRATMTASQQQYQLPSPAATILSRIDTDVCMSDGEDGNATRQMVGYHLSHGRSASSTSRPGLCQTFSSPITLRPATSSSGGTAAAAAAGGGGGSSDIGRRWWDTVVRSQHVATSPSGSPLGLRPAIHIDTDYKSKGEDDVDVDELVESEDGMSGVEEEFSTGGGASAVASPRVPFPGTPLGRFMAAHDAQHAHHVKENGGGVSSTPSSPYQYSRSMLLPPSGLSSSGGGGGMGSGSRTIVVPSPTPSTVSLPAAFNHHSHSHSHRERSPPSASSTSASVNRRTKPNYLNRPNVPLYNRSKLPTDGTLTEHIFTCNYIPPRSSNPLATHQPTTQPCETTSLKKADMLRHMDEIHAKDEAERVFRGDLELESASRYLADLAEMVVKETKADLEGSVVVNVPSSSASSSSPSASTTTRKEISNMVLRAQADSVRHNLRHEHDPSDANASALVRFDFVGMRCEEFREVAVMRLATHRVWRCVAAGCGKVFGTQRSMERHKANKHHQNQQSSSSSSQPQSQHAITSSYHQQENIASSSSSGSRGMKRPATDSPASSAPPMRHYLPASPLSRTSGPALMLETDRPMKRSRTEGSSGGGKMSTPMMRVRQQTPETRSSPNMPSGGGGHSLGSGGIGGGLQMDLGERSTLRSAPIKMEDDQLADDLLELAEGAR